ncbi:Uncharacterized protein Fot_56513 [Forsythia ovata]|uniref:Uncharacterized protein n=1 Tax=Forsythia ovata TaxID=205694 RepID=A0ABD1P0A3_9LAMI
MDNLNSQGWFERKKSRCEAKALANMRTEATFGTLVAAICRPIAKAATIRCSQADLPPRVRAHSRSNEIPGSSSDPYRAGNRNRIGQRAVSRACSRMPCYVSWTKAKLSRQWEQKGGSRTGLFSKYHST